MPQNGSFSLRLQDDKPCFSGVILRGGEAGPKDLF